MFPPPGPPPTTKICLKLEKILIEMDCYITQMFTGVNFINILRTHFLYERRFSTYM